MTAQEIYDHQVKDLSPADRLKLAAMILNGMPADAIIDERTDWSEDDLAALSAGSLDRAGKTLGDGDDADAR